MRVSAGGSVGVRPPIVSIDCQPSVGLAGLSAVRKEAPGPGDCTVHLQEPLEQYRSKDLRREVYRLKLRVTRKGADTNDHKKGFIALLREHRNGRTSAPTQELMFPEFVSTMAVPTRLEKTARLRGSPRVETTLASPVEIEDGSSSRCVSPAPSLPFVCDISVIPPTSLQQPNRTALSTSEQMTVRLLDTLFSDDYWHRMASVQSSLAQRNRLVRNHPNLITLLGPEESSEGCEFWSDVAKAVRKLEHGASDAVESNSRPAALFSTWKRICRLYKRGARDESRVTGEEARELAYLRSKLRQRPVLVETVLTAGESFSPFDASLPPRRHPAALATSAGGRSARPVFLTDDDDNANDGSSGSDGELNDKVARQSAPDEAHSTVTLADDETARLRHEFWRHKSKLAQQNVANAKLQFEIEQTGFLEHRLSGSKRKIEELRRELQLKAVDSEDAQLAADELQFYVQERKRLLAALRRRFAE